MIIFVFVIVVGGDLELRSLTEQGVSSTEEDSANTVPSETEEARRSQDGEAADVPPRYKVHRLPERSPGVYAEAKQPCGDGQNTRFFHHSPRSGHKFLGLLREENDKTKEAENTKSLSQGATNKEDDEPDVLVEVQRLQRTLVEETASANGEASHGPAVSSGSPTDAAPGQKDLPQKDDSLDFSGEDGVYRAKPIVIYETDDFFPESRPQDDVFSSVPSSQTLHNPPEEGNLSAPLPFFAVGSTTVEVSQQKVEEHTEQPPVSSTVLWTPSVDSRAMPKGEGQRSPPKTNYFLPRSPERSPLSSPDHQHRVKAQVQERPPSPAKSDSPKLKRQKEDVRRSPSKTCHPRVLPRESTSPQAPRIPGSPLKTFPINIDPQIPEEHLGRPTPMPRQRRSPSHQTKQAVLADTKNISEIPSPAAPQPTRVSEESLPSLARSRVPQDYQHYLGPHQKAFVPPFHQEKSTFADSCDPAEAMGPGVQVEAGKPNQGTRSMERFSFTKCRQRKAKNESFCLELIELIRFCCFQQITRRLLVPLCHF